MLYSSLKEFVAYSAECLFFVADAQMGARFRIKALAVLANNQRVGTIFGMRIYFIIGKFNLAAFIATFKF